MVLLLKPISQSSAYFYVIFYQVFLHTLVIYVYRIFDILYTCIVSYQTRLVCIKSEEILFMSTRQATIILKSKKI